MSVKNSRAYMAPIPKMPPGLVELMENLAKDVLKNNPSDVYAFCADHMKRLLDIRDSSTPKRVLTLDQKIAIAQQKVKERATLRHKNFDKTKILHCESKTHKEIHENKNLNKDDNDADQYDKEKIVKLSEVVLSGNAEHEIIVKKETNVVSELMDKPKIVVDSSATESIQPSTDVYEQETLNNHSNNITNDAIEVSLLNPVETNENDVMAENLKESMINPNENSKANDIVPENLYAENSLCNLENEIQSQISIETPVNEDDIICDKTLITDEIQDSKGSKERKPKNLNDINAGDAIINVTIFVGDHNDLHNVTQESESKIIDSGKENITAININTCNSSDTVDHNKADNSKQIRDQPSSILDEQNDNNALGEEASPGNNDNKSKLNQSKTQLNNTSMDLETAAITIQKVFRSFLFRNKTLSSDDATNVDIHLLIEDKGSKSETDTPSKDRRVLGLNRMDTVLQTVNEEKSLSLSTDDSSTLSSAATIIQAHVRGFLVRNRYNVNKNSSTTSGVDSEGLSATSLEGDNEQRKNKTILNIHIVPESGHFISRDESVLTSTDLSLDGSPSSSTNLHPLGHDTSERRKQLKREDAIQSISPPSNNSGKLSEDVDSVKEVLINSSNNVNGNQHKEDIDNSITDDKIATIMLELNDDDIPTMVNNDDVALEVKSLGPIDSPQKYSARRPQSLPEMTSDEMDVITPFTPIEEKKLHVSENDSNLLHSGEFHDVLLPTKVTRKDTSVVREPKINEVELFLNSSKHRDKEESISKSNSSRMC